MSDDRDGKMHDATEAMIGMRDPAPRLPIIRNGSVADIADEELLRRAVESARRHTLASRPHPRWVAVMDAFMLGSTYANQLCVRFGFDPDEQVKR